MNNQRTTIPKHRVADFLKKVTRAKVFTLENHFSGKPIEDLAHMRDWAVKLQGKVRIVKASHTGEIHYHSNHWVEFEYGDPPL